MTSQGSNPAFENISQRVVFSHQRQMPEFDPVLPDSLSPSEQRDLYVAQQELDAFFRALYQSIYDHPETFGLPTAEDVYVDRGDDKEQKQAVARQVKKPRDKMVHGVDFLYHVAQRGTPVEGQLRLGKDEYDSFFAKRPRVKQKLVRGMLTVGLDVSEQNDAVLVSNTRYPHMMPALQALAQACALRDDERLGTWLFARCDLRALDAGYQPDILETLQTALSPAELEHAIELHHALTEMAYKPTLEIGGVHNWRVRYQGKRKIKATPLFEYEYDEREKHPLRLRVKCVATNRLVPLLAQQPALLQQDFFRHAHNCGAPKCSWCKTRKGLNPSVLKYAGERRTICWWMQRHFTELDHQAVDLVRQYALLHEMLLAA
jgi:hypothetical protein